MKFEALKVRNFRGLHGLDLDELGDVVVLAGANGSGKSAALDAIRLLKSTYAGYQDNEVTHWFSEFQIDPAKPGAYKSVMRRADEPLEISARISLAEQERRYIQDHAEQIVEPLIWQNLGPQHRKGGRSAVSALQPDQMAHLQQQVSDAATLVRSSLSEDVFELRLHVGTNLQPKVTPSPIFEAIFQHWNPKHLGVIEFHSASRAYQRELIGNVNLDVTADELRRSHHSLYNWQGKFNNIKGELASHYVQALIARESGSLDEQNSYDDLNRTLTELFRVFFPDKEYRGVHFSPDGALEFPVYLASGEVHDIDDLGSGEKEIVYGYLRLRASAPQNSVILLDEPELHLNPGLLQGLPDFYHQHLGRDLGNQIWLVTHSDAILRQAVGNASFSVFHLRSATSLPAGAEQVVRVELDAALERAVIDLVGDLAAYKPHAKVVILEGGGDTEFDRAMVRRLFPELENRVNLVSGGNKRRVSDLHDVLNSTAARAGLSDRFFAIVDRDDAPVDISTGPNMLTWDRYHIENYLLEPAYVLAAVQAVAPSHTLTSAEGVREALKSCAVELVPELVMKRLQTEINDRLVGALRIGGHPGEKAPAVALRPSLESSVRRVGEVGNELLKNPGISALEQEAHESIQRAIDEDTWDLDIPGRLILRRFAGKHLQMRYEHLKHLIVNQMLADEFRPAGMAMVIDQILSTPASAGGSGAGPR